MQYFKEHFNDNISETGFLQKINDEFYVGDIKIKYLNRVIIGDTVIVKDNEIIGIKERMNKNIVGILYLDSKTKYGSFNNKPLYLFKPSNKDYPNFYIPSDSSSKTKTFSVISFKEWKTTDKLPIGTLVETIGLVGDKDSEIEHLRIYYEIKNNTWKIKNEKIKKDEEMLNDLAFNYGYDYEVFSIDPIGSKDIDDAFHFKNVGDNNYEIGIHIASPTVFFGKEKEDILNILNRVSTVYLTDKKYNLLPNIYADNLVSLLENKVRFALSIIFVLDKELNIISETVQKTVVKNIKNYNYDEFDNLYNKNSVENNNEDYKKMLDFINISEIFFRGSLMQASYSTRNHAQAPDLWRNNNNHDNRKEFNSHHLVEEWMIYSNKRVANYLINKNCSNIILRKHESKNNNLEKLGKINNINIDSNIDSRLINFLKIREENSAVYEIYDSIKNNILEGQTHSKLGNEFYTHFTSPIRRGVDFAIHLLIIANLEGKHLDYNFDENIINKINTFTKNTRKFGRQLRRLEFIYELKNKDDIIRETFGYITKITKNKISLYLPEYNLEEKIVIIPYKLEDIVEIYFFDDNIIKFKIGEEKEKEYKLYEKLKLKLYVFTSFENIFDKLKIEILE